MKKSVSSNNLYLVLSFGFLVALASCKKDEDNLSAKEKQITAREWRITAITRPSVSTPAVDSNILKACTSDDRLFFGSGKSFQLRDNTVKCDSSIFFYDNGSWSLNAAQDQIQLNGTRKIQRWKIIQLNDSIMRVQWRDSLSPSNIVLKTIALKNK